MTYRVPLILIALAGHVAASGLERVRVFEEAKGCVLAESGRPFIPWGFNYDLMNEPVVPGGNKKRDDWLGPGFGGKHFVQFIALDRKNRDPLVVHHEGVTPDKVQKIKAAGIEVGAWTVNDRATMRRLLDMGIERIYTDHPRLLLLLKSPHGFQNIKCEGTYRHHLQGICTDDKDAVYWSFTTTLVKTDTSGNVVKKIEVGNHVDGRE